MADPSPPSDPLAELERTLALLETLLKDPVVGQVLAGRAVNTSLALVAAEGLRAYLEGNKTQAAEDFETVAEEIRARLAMPATRDLTEH